MRGRSARSTTMRILGTLRTRSVDDVPVLELPSRWIWAAVVYRVLVVARDLASRLPLLVVHLS